MTDMTRRALLARAGATGAGLALTGSLLAACGDSDSEEDASPSGGAAEVATQLVFIKNAEYGGYWIADDRGFYREENVAPKFLAGGPNLPSASSVITGGGATLAIGEQLQAVADAVTKGADLVVLAGVFQKSPSGILSLPETPIREAGDIIGKRIGLQQGAKEFVDALLKVNGLPADYEQVPVGFDPTPLTEGACDGYVCFVTNQPLILKQKGIPYVATTYSDMGLPSYAGVVFAEREYVESNRAAVVGFLRASIKGWEINQRAPDLSAQLAVTKYGKDLKLDLAQQKLQAQAQVPLIKSDLTDEKGLLWLDQDQIAGPVYDGFRASGRTSLPPVERLIDLSPLEEAYNGKTALTTS